MKLFLVGGARPNFIKIAPITRACDKLGVHYKLIHTGQHYDFNMSDIFFEQLNIRQPDYNLGVGSTTHANQVAKIMQRFEKVCLQDMPDIVMVVGDVNSTLACSLVVSKMANVKLAHVEAGLRCFDRHKPEEVNRVVTDILSDYLFVTVDYAIDNLTREGIEKEKIFLIGDVMLDSLMYNLRSIKTKSEKKYVLVTIHRPLSTDTIDNLRCVLKSLSRISKDIEVIFPIHPRTMNKINEFNLNKYTTRLTMIDPVGYIDFLDLLINSSAVITDSGGVQIETSFLGIPCISIMRNTSHLYTLKNGTNRLVEYTVSDIYEAYVKAALEAHLPYRDELTDGKASERIINILLESYNV